MDYKDYIDTDLRCNFKTLTDYYIDKNIKFTFLNPDGDNLEQKGPWHGCRGYLNALWCKSIHPGFFKYSGQNITLDYKYNLGPLILSIYNIKREIIEKAIVLINNIEDKVGWDKSYICKIKDLNSSKSKWTVFGHNRWIRSPIYSSLMAFIIRTVYYNSEIFDEDLITFLNSVIKQEKNTVYEGKPLDTQHWYNLMQISPNVIYWLMEYQDKILGPNPEKFFDYVSKSNTPNQRMGPHSFIEMCYNYTKLSKYPDKPFEYIILEQIKNKMVLGSINRYFEPHILNFTLILDECLKKEKDATTKFTH